jgi:hypothetical protein
MAMVSYWSSRSRLVGGFVKMPVMLIHGAVVKDLSRRGADIGHCRWIENLRQLWIPAIYCGRATWSLALYRQRDYLLASIRDRKDTQHIDIKKAYVSRFLPPLVAMLSQLND